MCMSMPGRRFPHEVLGYDIDDVRGILITVESIAKYNKQVKQTTGHGEHRPGGAKLSKKSTRGHKGSSHRIKSKMSAERLKNIPGQE